MRSRPRTRTTYGTPSESSIRWSSSRTNTGGLTGWTARRAGRDNQPRVPTLKLSRHTVERHPSDRPIEAGAERTIEVLVREERVDVEKQAVVYEEVGVGKRQVTETEQVSGTARREEARVEREGDVDVRGGTRRCRVTGSAGRAGTDLRAAAGKTTSRVTASAMTCAHGPSTAAGRGAPTSLWLGTSCQVSRTASRARSLAVF